MIAASPVTQGSAERAAVERRARRLAVEPIGAGAAWVSQYAGKAPWATEANLKSLIGPNWKQ